MRRLVPRVARVELADDVVGPRTLRERNRARNAGDDRMGTQVDEDVPGLAQDARLLAAHAVSPCDSQCRGDGAADRVTLLKRASADVR